MKHFGKELQKVIESSGIPVTELAERMGMSRRNIYKLIEKESIDLKLAVKLSEGLQHDFIQNYLLPGNYKLLKSAQIQVRQNQIISRQNQS